MSKRFARQEKSQPKHSHYSSTQPITRNSVVVPTNPSSRPEWRGSGFHKPKKKAPPKTLSRTVKEKDSEIGSCIPEKLQREFLTVVKNAFPVCTEDYEELKPLLTEVKSLLDVGGKELEENLAENQQLREAFLVRWGVERALLLSSLLGRWAETEFNDEAVFRESRRLTLRVVCFGSGITELSALAIFLRKMHHHVNADEAVVTQAAQQADPDNSRQNAKEPSMNLRLLVYGSSDWSPELDALRDGLNTPPALSKYASAAAKAAASPFLPPTSLEMRHEVLSSLNEFKLNFFGDSPCLITFCFSLREMRNASLTATLKQLLAVGRDTPKGSLLLVIDDVESPKTLKEKERYPLEFVLDLALLEKGVRKVTEGDDPNAGDGDKEHRAPAWEKLLSHSEQVFKPERCAEYPISLGKVAVQVHLFRKK